MRSSRHFDSVLGLVGSRRLGSGTFCRFRNPVAFDFACFPVSVRYNSSVDAVKQPIGHSKGRGESTTPQIRQCRYCKGRIEVDPKFPHKTFCRDECRKSFHRYGALPVVKLQQNFAKTVNKLGDRMDRELTPVRQQLAILEGALKTTGLLMRELNQRIEALERADLTQRAIERVLRGENTKRGGGAAA